MKATLFITILLVVGLISCKKSNNTINRENSSLLDTVTFSHSMKGWELYSWPTGNDWTYSILMGTNRGKSLEEVTANTIKVVGKDNLKILLTKFPPNENILWAGNGWLANTMGDHSSLTLPDSDIVNEIKVFCIQKGLELIVIN